MGGRSEQPLIDEGDSLGKTLAAIGRESQERNRFAAVDDARDEGGVSSTGVAFYSLAFAAIHQTNLSFRPR
ncbi:MAG: hypothetical protein LUO79_07770 [Methanomassiliicoccales archaeon]|nr:hypothetical protein [Methanomassiliicoccales archaeon]